jgi:hypothetical protein
MMPTTSLSHLGFLFDAQVVESPVMVAIGYVVSTLNSSRVGRAAPNERLGFLMSKNYWTEDGSALHAVALSSSSPSRPLFAKAALLI